MFPWSEGATASALINSAFAAEPAGQQRASSRVSLGLLTYCFGLGQKFSARVPGTPAYGDPLVFLREAARLGANAVQIPFGLRDRDAVQTIRQTAEQLGIALESTLPLPQSDSELAKFEAEMQTLHDLGVAVTRTVVFPGRRYEDLHSYSAYQNALKGARERIHRAEPVARKQGIRLAIENHKDQRMEERLALLKEFESEYVGACVDVGNNISLLEDPTDVSRALAPWAFTVHFKDQGVREYENGFLLADVPLGQGCIDLQPVINVIREKKPTIHFQLELITRDPLKVPILTDAYWASFRDVKASTLSTTWGMVKKRGAREPFSSVSTLSPAEQVALERQNIEESFRFAAQHLSF
jgi:sugar phosphate isomerase/epimerase